MIFNALLAAVVALQGAAAPPPASGGDRTAQAYFLFIEGRLLEGRGDVAGAIAAYRQAADLAPNAGEIRAELASVFARQNRVAEAVSEAEAALRIEPDNRQAHRILGFVQAALAERPAPGTSGEALVSQAIGHFERTLADGRHDPAVEIALGRLYLQVGRHDAAIATLRTFLQNQPGYPEGMMLLAEAYESTGRMSDTVGLLEDVIRVDPDQIRARVWLADLYERAGRWKDAAAAWGDLVKLGAGARSYRPRYATALVNAGDVDGGRRELVAITRDTPRDVSAWFLLSQVERRAGNAAGAEEAARRIAEIDPEDARGPLALAEARTARGDFRGAAGALEARVAAGREDDVKNGTYARMATSLAEALQGAGDQARAVTVLETAQRHAPTDIGLEFELAAAYDRNSRPADAERVFRALIAKDPQNASALNYLGYMLAERGQRLDEAVALVKRALAIEADNPSYLDSLGWAYFKQGSVENARDPLERAATALPQNSVIQDHLGDLYFQLKRFRDAQAAFDRALAGDRDGIDVAAVTKKRDRARELAGK
jgi:tetratricopeptide (TPR) repeat protein